VVLRALRDLHKIGLVFFKPLVSGTMALLWACTGMSAGFSPLRNTLHVGRRVEKRRWGGAHRRFGFFGQSLIGANDAVLLLASPSAALAPWGAPRPLRIQTRPPISPTTNVAAPKRIDSVNPSPSARPANAKAAIMLLSRTPHPAIDIGMVETNRTGGKR